MRRSRRLLSLCLVVAFAFLITQAQLSVAQIPGMPKLYGEFKMPEVGAFATYKVVNIKNKAERITKLAIVGKEKSEKGKDLYWYEVVETDPDTSNVVVMKMLISGNPQEIGTIHRMIIKSGKEPASELPQALVELINQPLPKESKTEKPKMKNLGTEKIEFKEKKLDCTHFKYISNGKTTAEVWTNKEVPLFGLVKSTSPEMTLQLIDYGTNAVSVIKEKPQVLEMPEKK